MNLLLSVENAVGYLVLNRPENHNAVSKAMWQSLPNALETLKANGAKIIVLTGQGQSFASGADLDELKSLDSYESAQAQWDAISKAIDFLWSFSMPTIAKINGPCLGGGLLLALACDLRYASEKATFGIPIARLGIILDERNIKRLVRLVLPGRAKELLFLGTLISAFKAEEIGLVNAVVKIEELDALVGDVVAKIAHNAANSILRSKESVNRAQLQDEEDSPQDERELVESYLSDDLKQRILHHRLGG